MKREEGGGTSTNSETGITLFNTFGKKGDLFAGYSSRFTVGQESGLLPPTRFTVGQERRLPWWVIPLFYSPKGPPTRVFLPVLWQKGGLPRRYFSRFMPKGRLPAHPGMPPTHPCGYPHHRIYASLHPPGYTPWSADTKLTVQCTGGVTVLYGGLYLRGWSSGKVQKGVF